MSMKKIKDAVVKTGEYTNNAGETKGRFLNVGALFQRDDGSTCMKMDCLPLIAGDVWINFYGVKERAQGGGGDHSGRADNAPEDLDDSEQIPFIHPYPTGKRGQV